MASIQIGADNRDKYFTVTECGTWRQGHLAGRTINIPLPRFNGHALYQFCVCAAIRSREAQRSSQEPGARRSSLGKWLLPVFHQPESLETEEKGSRKWPAVSCYLPCPEMSLHIKQTQRPICSLDFFIFINRIQPHVSINLLNRLKWSPSCMHGCDCTSVYIMCL